jgi:hypothetical protein
MSTILGNGTITFGDGTVKSTVGVALANISGAPTKLSEFTNDLGNYGSFLSATNVNQDVVNAPFNGKYAGPVRFSLAWDGTTLRLTCPNCNCHCNC